MDLMRKEVLDEMVRNGRAYRHEIQSIAHELLERRAGRDPTAFDGMTILVPRAVLVESFKTPKEIRYMKGGQTMMVLFDPIGGPRTYAIVHKLDVQL